MALVIISFIITGETNGAQPSETPLGFDPYLTFSGNVDASFHKTQFFEEHHNAFVGQWDTRVEAWAPPNRKNFAWGGYLRIAGIAASQSEAWENAWLGGPGVGAQVYPFSHATLRSSSNPIVKALGATRVFAEYNRLDYWGQENAWRPKGQIRAGLEHWRSMHVNDVASRWWAETWNGLIWQSANEFSSDYHSWILGNAVRSGLRAPGLNLASAFTPYAAVESSLTDNRSYYWENRLLAGAGLRYAPPLRGVVQEITRVNRFAIYAEYLHVGPYYRQAAPSTIPNYEIRVGITLSTGLWYH